MVNNVRSIYICSINRAARDFRVGRVRERARTRDAPRRDAPTRGRSSGRAIRTHSISVSWKRKPAWRSRRRTSTNGRTDARTHARTFVRSRDLVPFVDVAFNSTYASVAELDISLRDRVTTSRRVPHRAASCRVVLAIFIFILDSDAASNVVWLLWRRRPRRRRVAWRRPARHAASHPREFQRATRRRFATSFVDVRRSHRRQPASSRRPRRRQSAAGRQSARHWALPSMHLRRIESH